MCCRPAIRAKSGSWCLPPLAAYGYGAIGRGITEEKPFHCAGAPSPPALYGATKVLGEQLCKLYREQHGLDYIAMRYSTVYGERQHDRSTNALYIIEAYDRVARGLPPVLAGDGSDTKNFVYVGDVARTNVLAMASSVAGEALDISGGRALSVKFLAETVIRLAGAPMQPEYRDAGSLTRGLSHYRRCAVLIRQQQGA